jgi:hypothetical protein
MKKDLFNLKEKQLILIEGKKFEIVGLGWEGRLNKDTGRVRNCREYGLHEIGSKLLWPTSFTFCDDTNKAYFGNKEIKLENIKIL